VHCVDAVAVKISCLLLVPLGVTTVLLVVGVSLDGQTAVSLKLVQGL